MFNRIVFIIAAVGMLLVPLTAFSDTARDLVKKGNRAYAAGNYDKAIEAYEEATVNLPESPRIYFDKGAAYYQKKDYEKAINAFEQAALKSKDTAFEASSKFNMGLCWFRKAERQMDSDLNKALEACGTSIRHFQEALELNPELKEAAENIEMVRLMMKSILDKKKKQEEAAKKQQKEQQKVADQIKELIEKQQGLLDESRNATAGAQKNGKSKKLFDQIQNMATRQTDLKEKTKTLSESMAAQKSPATDKTGPVRKHLDESAGAQTSAIDQLKQSRTETAETHQKQSLDALKKALASMNENKHPKGQKSQPKQQPGEKQQLQKPQGQSGESSPGKENQRPEDEKQKAGVAQLPDDAHNILNEEKENKRARHKFSSGGYQDVDRDW